jgi:hypothetical protein
MKVQVTVLLNVEIARSDYAMEDGSTDDNVCEELHMQIDEGCLSLDDLMEQSADYTVTVVKG